MAIRSGSDLVVWSLAHLIAAQVHSTSDQREERCASIGACLPKLLKMEVARGCPTPFIFVGVTTDFLSAFQFTTSSYDHSGQKFPVIISHVQSSF